MVGARRVGGSVQVVLLGAGSRLGLEALAAEQGTDAARLADVRARNGAAIDSAAASDWLPLSVSADADTGLPLGQGAPAIECGDIYAPATPSGLQLLTLVDLNLNQGFDSWSASGLYTGNVQVFAESQRWALVTEPWWSVSEEAAQRAALGAPETLLHTFDTAARQLEPRGSIALRAAPQHDPVVTVDGEHWFLATHAAYGPALSGADQGRLWSFQTRSDALELLGKSPAFPLSPETQTEFAPGVAYVHDQGGSDAAARSVVIDLSDPRTLETEDGPSGDFRVLPWSAGQHLRVDLSQIHLLSGLRELEQYPQGPEPSFVAYTLPEQGWLLDVQGPSYRRTLRFRRLAQPNATQTMGSIRIRSGTLLPPLIEDDLILNGSYEPRGISGFSASSLEVIDANTFGSLGSVGGG